MKKTLIAMGVLSAVSTFAFANSNVTLYGVIEEGVVVSKAKSEDAVVQLKSGFDQGSRWGIKGVEDLGNGYNIGFILEQGFNVDDGTEGAEGYAFNREAFLYVTSGFGKVGFGRTGALTFAQSNAILTGWAFGTGFGLSAWSSKGSGVANWNRMSNVIAYNTPSFGGFSFHAMYSNGQTTDTDKWSGNNHYYGIGALYNANNIKSSLVFEAGDNKGTGHWKSDEHNAWIAAKKTQYAITYGLEYNMGVVTPMFIYQYNWQDRGNKANVFGLSAKVNVAGGDLLLGTRYTFGKDDSVKVGEDKFNNWNIGAAYIYPLSKRTAIKAYAGYAKSGKLWKEKGKPVAEDGEVGTDTYQAAAAGDPTYNGYQFYLGVRHSF